MESFSLGQVLGTGFRVWFRNLLPFLLITAILYAPYAIWLASSVQGEPSFEDLKRLNVVHLIAVPLLNILISSALVYGVVMELKGQHASLGSCLGTGLLRFFPVLGVAILTIIVIVGGMFLLLVPGLIAACALYVTTQAAVLERPGVFGALSRSAELTSGHRWKIFGILIIMWLIGFVSSKLTESLIVTKEISPETFYGYVRRFYYVDLGLSAVLGSLSATMSSAAYYYLRRDKEGTSADELGKVFE